MEYPKIETLYERKPNGKVDTTKLKLEEFGIITRWQVTEKVNGRNIRIMLSSEGEVTIAGRHDEKHLSDQLDVKMIDYLKTVFTPNRMKYIFRKINKEGILEKPEVCMYMEGLGSCMASGSGIYCQGRDISVRLIDVYIKPFWLQRNSLEDIAKKFGIKCVPLIGYISSLPNSRQDLEAILKFSKVANEVGNRNTTPEGIVAQPYPLLFTRTTNTNSIFGERVIWKLKYKDFEK